MDDNMISKVMAASYAAAADLLEAAAKGLREAAKAAESQNANLARGIAIGAEGELARAQALTGAASALHGIRKW